MNENKGYFVTAIGTDSGKTFFSAILTEALEADYWKPVQAGFPTDTETIKGLISNKNSVIHPERYVLNTPASPHAAARIDEVEIKLSDFELPNSGNKLVVEGAGGILVPINDEDTIGDLIKQLKLPLILVSNLYLGSINHTLLSTYHIKQKNLPVAGLVFNGPSNPESERIIEKHTGWPVLLRIPRYQEVNPELVSELAHELKHNLTT